MIVKRDCSDEQVLRLFSEHDDFMINFLGEDRRYYTRYTDGENLEAVWVAYQDGEPAGCAAYRRKDGNIGEIKRVFVREAYRGRGLAKALFAAVKEHARAEGCRKLFLDTRSTLEPAVTMYRNLGFRVIFQQGLYIQMETTID